MERTMSVEEKIRRAEEIYNRRNQNQYIYQKPKVKSKKESSLMQRMIKQILICFLIYGVFYVITNREYYLSQEFLTKVEQEASKNDNIKKAYNWLMQYVEKYIPKSNGNNLDSTENEQKNDDSPTEEQNTASTNDENIGGASEEVVNNENEKTQEQIDIEQIKEKISFEKPIDGTISSTFGWRTPTTKTVPKYHTGLDIAAKTGTIIKSATDGNVILASSEGDYGKHYKIQINDVIIIYAHCSKLYLNEGDTVKQGQEIAEVGSTRKLNTVRTYILK